MIIFRLEFFARLLFCQLPKSSPPVLSKQTPVAAAGNHLVMNFRFLLVINADSDEEVSEVEDPMDIDSLSSLQFHRQHLHFHTSTLNFHTLCRQLPHFHREL